MTCVSNYVAVLSTPLGAFSPPSCHDQCLTHFALQLGKGKCRLAGPVPTKIVFMIRKLHLDTARSANSTGNEEECTGGGDQQSEVPR